MIKCDSHGLSPVIEYCAHISDAVDQGLPRPVHLEMDGWNNAHALCDVCHPKALDVIRRGSSADGAPHDFYVGSSRAEGGCFRCFDEWYGRTGVGSLADAIQGAEQRHARRSATPPR
jgi:hypothetical protein